ncbi:uncharacterized protein LOC115728876 [Rhodamnia argentea]|uniref:Uncharacterized protein LOC115728876 n=1 Tax=Rhodamnia argentea TaxID=178133 RepID=A0A8B8MZ21_9MYRT|nr:uncharacterized protein LOC115728876 [Rhodamnia argentea]
MATHEKPKKLGLFTNFYKSGTAAAGTGKINCVAKPDTPAFTNKYIARGWMLRKPRNCPESRRGGGDQLVRASSGRGEDGGGGGGGGGGGNEMVVVEARKSVSHVETNLASVVAFLQVKVMVADMPGFMQVHAFRCARTTYDSLEKFSAKHMAYNIKKEFDKVYGPAWHCIVGSNFGSFVTHATGGFLYFSMEKLYILLFKTKVQKAID